MMIGKTVFWVTILALAGVFLSVSASAQSSATSSDDQTYAYAFSLDDIPVGSELRDCNDLGAERPIWCDSVYGENITPNALGINDADLTPITALRGEDLYECLDRFESPTFCDGIYGNSIFGPPNPDDFEDVDDTPPVTNTPITQSSTPKKQDNDLFGSNLNLSGNYNSSTSFAWGDITGWGYQNGSGDWVTLADASFNGGSSNFLGCAGANLIDYLQYQLNINFEEILAAFKAHLQTVVVKYLLTQLFSIPAVAAVFDTLQAFGNARFEMFQASCDINEIRADAKEIMRERCLKENDGDQLKCQDPGSLEFTKKLKEAADGLIGFLSSSMRSLNDAMGMTSFCGGEGRQDCGLMALIPQFRICGSAGIGSSRSGDSCSSADRTGAAAVSAGDMLGSLSGVFEAILSLPGAAVRDARASLTQDQLELSAKNARAAAASGAAATPASSGGAGDLVAQADTTRMDFINIRLPQQFFAADTASENATSDQAEEIKKEFEKFLQCSQFDALKHVEKYLTQVDGDWKTTFSGNLSTYQAELKEQLESFQIDFGGYDFVAALGEGQNETGSAGGAAIKSVAENLDALLNTGINCIMNHHVHISIEVVLELQRLGIQMETAFYAAAANRAAYLLTELFLRFTKQQILKAIAEVSGNQTGFAWKEGGKECGNPGKGTYMKPGAEGAVECNGPGNPKTREEYPFPEGVVIALQTVAEMFENQIQALNAIRLERDKFAEIIAKMPKVQEAMQNGQI